MCAGSHLANRELYTAFLRIIISCEIHPCADPADRPILDCLGCNAIPTSLTLEPKPFKISLKPRNAAQVKGWIEASEARTAHL